MITTKSPVGEIINFLYKNDDAYKDESLLKEIRNLVDLIIIRADKDGINETLKSLEGDLFKLRFKIINEFQSFQNITENLNNSIQDRIRFQFNQSTNQKKLELAFVNSINIYGKIADFLKQNGIVEIEALNESFNSDMHEAVTVVAVDNEALKGKVIEVTQKGYTLNEKVIRFPKVIIGE